MPGQHTEHAFETAIQHSLTTAGGYRKGDRDAFDLERGVFARDVLAFIKKSQPKEWEYLAGIQKDKAETTLLDALCQALDSDHEGCLAVLRHGFKCFGKLFRVAYFAPASGMNPDTQALYQANDLSRHPAATLFAQAQQHARCDAGAERHPGRHAGTQEPHDRPDVAQRYSPVPDRP